MKNQVYYSDFYIGFKPNATDSDLIVLEDEESIKQGVKNIVLLNFFERFQHPFLGTNTTAELFENIDPISARIIKTRIETALRNFCPYASVLSVLVSPDIDENAFAVTITFGVINLSSPMTVDFFLRRVR